MGLPIQKNGAMTEITRKIKLILFDIVKTANHGSSPTVLQLGIRRTGFCKHKVTIIRKEWSGVLD